MRTRTVVGLAIAGGTAAVAMGFGGTALAAGPEQADPAVQVTVDNGRAATPDSDTGPAVATDRDCPEKDGSSGPESGTGSPAADQAL
ncbi:hypothetical protein M1L60_00460 [Actinoplanes sp. TRM 88003]|uniref:Uncharacterized protein n=1 Tax=Paractinoplanes aksuensis TaxID=2939490 RepID=A0ABT1DE40_9ACTN|nr:hypothetical protein [Actinoplanes aksuensis]MCO8269055.1 hypothetical protein [Actinoplanes aksuensis]